MLELTKRLMTEGLISMSEAAKMFGSCRSGAPTHPGTMTRKCLKGDPLPDGTRLKLAHVRVANRLMTSREAVLRHIAALTAAFETAPAVTFRSPAQRNRVSEAAARDLNRPAS